MALDQATDQEDVPTHVRHWPVHLTVRSCNQEGCDVVDVSRLRYYICGLRCNDHKPEGGAFVKPRPEPTYVSTPIKQPTGRPALPRRRARRKK